MKIINDDGIEIEVYTAEEVQTQIAQKEAEFTTVKTTLETELDGAKKALGERAGQFAQFRKLNEETIAKLSVAERTIYENGLALEEARLARETAEKKNYESIIDSTIRAKAGNDEKLVAKMKDMWSIIGIEAQTPDAIENKARMVMGAISTTEPDLLASVSGFSGGSWNNKPDTKINNEKSFADTDVGKAFGAELGLKLDIEKK
jgi:hypothetical protein